MTTTTLYADTPDLVRRGFMTRAGYWALSEDQRGRTSWPSGAVDLWVILGGEKLTVRLYESADQFPLTLDNLHVPIGAKIAYAYSPRETANSRGGTHLYWDLPFESGRVKRDAAIPLCGKATHWGLEPQVHQDVTCVKCAAMARRLFPARLDRVGVTAWAKGEGTPNAPLGLTLTDLVDKLQVNVMRQPAGTEWTWDVVAPDGTPLFEVTVVAAGAGRCGLIMGGDQAPPAPWDDAVQIWMDEYEARDAHP